MPSNLVEQGLGTPSYVSGGLGGANLGPSIITQGLGVPGLVGQGYSVLPDVTVVLARRRIRLAAQAVLQALTGVTVESPGDWSIAPDRLPNIKVRTPSDRKSSVARTMPEFTTTVTLEVMATVRALTDSDAQDQLDALGQLIENALFTCEPLVTICQQFTSVNTQTDITAEGECHVARLVLSVDCETFEKYDPLELNPGLYPSLTQVNVHLDTMRPFDPTATYGNQPFTRAVKPAPRTSGPDGRDEAALQINLPT